MVVKITMAEQTWQIGRQMAQMDENTETCESSSVFLKVSLVRNLYPIFHRLEIFLKVIKGFYFRLLLAIKLNNYSGRKLLRDG